MSRTFVLGVLAAWLLAAALLTWLAPGMGAAYLVASAWVAVGGLAVWALARWPPFRRTLAGRRRRPGNRDATRP
jgi:hypothetical protein